MEAEKKLSPALRYYYKNVVNKYPCPVCGRTISKPILLKHNKSLVHELALLKAEKAQREAMVVS